MAELKYISRFFTTFISRFWRGFDVCFGFCCKFSGTPNSLGLSEFARHPVSVIRTEHPGTVRRKQMCDQLSKYFIQITVLTNSD